MRQLPVLPLKAVLINRVLFNTINGGTWDSNDFMCSVIMISHKDASIILPVQFSCIPSDYNSTLYKLCRKKKDSTDHHLLTGLGLNETKKEGRKEGDWNRDRRFVDGSISSGSGWPHL